MAQEETPACDRARQLEEAIREVVGQNPDGIWWLDAYRKLAGMVGVLLAPDLPPEDQFRANCSRLADSLYQGRPYVPDGLGDAIRERDALRVQVAALEAERDAPQELTVAYARTVAEMERLIAEVAALKAAADSMKERALVEAEYQPIEAVIMAAAREMGKHYPAHRKPQVYVIVYPKGDHDCQSSGGTDSNDHRVRDALRSALKDIDTDIKDGVKR